ncbi:MAG: family 43 glycosylhydrolase, partial [Prevotellaceae bacterium]|nr:family 43 glycosylhydrolase [Prevotellaceae bacterium]
TCSTDPVTKTAYAPEVVYWNGKFYMYTSPGGNGHYVLQSDSPTGPFTAVTGNIGKSIDGSVFVDDDGRWYFYHADNSGIMGCTMSSPTAIGNSVNLNAKTGYGWTEGPCVLKRNGTYYLFYTGNHVISKGYRIDYAKNTAGPISAYTPQSAQNPILISSEGSFVGLGHGSAFIGPDLDSYYFTYHNLAGDYGVGPYRRLNFDRIAWNGEKLLLLGPTTWAQQGFPLAATDYFDRADLGDGWTTPNGGSWSISNQDFLLQDAVDGNSYRAIFAPAAAADYTAEFTVREAAQTDGGAAALGAVFGYSSEQNYGVALLNSADNRLEVNFLVDNVWGTPQRFSLPSGFNHAAWHSIRIEKVRTSYTFFVDGMKKASIESRLQGGSVGYMASGCRGNFSYIALSDKVNGSGIYDIYKPVPGIIAAVHYCSGGEGVGYHDLTRGYSDSATLRYDDVDVARNAAGGYHICDNSDGEWYRYNVNVEAAGAYNMDVRYAAADTCRIKIRQGEAAITGAVCLPPTGSAASWGTLTLKGLNLDSGYQTLKIETLAGSFGFYEMKLIHADNEAVVKTDDFEGGFSSEWNYSDGGWRVESGQAVIDGTGKRTFGSAGWSDYTVEADVTYIRDMNAGIIFRVSNPALGGAGNDPALGTDYLQGYFVTLGSNSVTLGKHNYSWTTLATSSGSYSLNAPYHIKVVASGANIKVYVGDAEAPVIDYTDDNPFMSGKVGFRVHSSHARFDNFSVATSAETVPEPEPEPEPGQETAVGREMPVSDVELFPNPASEKLTIRNIQDFSDLAVYSMDGQKIYSRQLSGGECTISTSGFTRGVYVLSLSNKSENHITRKFVKQ